MWKDIKQTEFQSGPEVIDESNVQYWCRHSKELKNNQVQKALKFLKYDCIKYIGKAFEQQKELDPLMEKYPDAKHIFICLPLNRADAFDFFGKILRKKPYEKDYNSSEYIIYKRNDGTFCCNCQGYQTKLNRDEIIYGGANCSHILSLLYCFKTKRFGRNEGAEEHHLKADMEVVQ